MRRWGHIGLVAVIAAATAMTGCSNTGGGTNAAAGPDTVVVGVDSDITSPDLSRYQNLSDIFPTTNIFDTLTFRGRDGSTQPMIATDWKVSDDGLEWTVNIRTDVVFHNGEPLTAEDVAYSVLRLGDKAFAEPVTQYWASVDEAKVVDKDTVLFRLSKPNGLFMQQGTRAAIVPKAYAEKVGPKAFSASPIASGPYKFVEWVSGERLVLAANENYWQGKPPIKNVIFRPIVEEASRTAALRSGEVDIVHPLGLDQLDLVKQDKKLEVRTTPSIERQRLYMDNKTPPFNDVRVRKAINHAINKEELVNQLLEGHAEVMAGITVPLEQGYNPDLKPYEYDPERARKLLAEAGYPDGFTVGFAVQTGYPKSEEVSQAIAGYLAAVGIKTKTRLYDDAAYADASREHKLEPLAFHGWGGGGQFHATHYFNVAVRCEGGSVVWSGYYCNRELDRHVDEAFRLWGSDEEAAVKHLREAQRIYYEDAGVGFLYLNTRVYGVKADLQWEPRSDGLLWMKDATWR